ncbi:MAG: tape measure protein [Prevotella sp.]|nr:tape measure protein [Prevotella sp.]
MAELYFKVGSDWQEVVKLRLEIAKLETQLANMGSNADPMNIKRLESQLASAKARFEELTAAAAIAASQIKDSMATVDMSPAIKQIRDFDTQIQAAVGSLDNYFTALRSKMQGALSSLQIGDIQIGNVEVPNADTSQVGELRHLYTELAEQIRQQSAEVETQHQKWVQLAESIRSNNVDAIRQLTQEFAKVGNVDLGISNGSANDTGAKFDTLSAKIQKAKQDVDALQVTVDKLWQLVRNGNTNITIGVQADFDKIQQLYDSIAKLETKVKDMDWGADPLHIKELCNQIKTSSEQIKTAVEELTRKTAALGSSVSAIGAGHVQLRQLDQQLTNTRTGFGNLSRAANVAALTMERDGAAAAMALSGALNRVYGDAMMLTTTLLGGLGLEQLIVTVATTRSQFQQLEMSFNTMLGSAEKAQALTTQLVATAAKTPFDMTSITQGAKQLLAYGTQAEEVNDILVHLGDIAAGLSLPLGDLVYLYGTTMAQGRMFTMDLRQFMGRGIPMAEALAKQFGVSANEVGKLVTEGKVTADVFKKAILEMSSEGGRFGGLMEKQAATIGGRWSNIGDSVQQMFNDIGKESEGAIGAGLDIVSDLVENWRTVGKFILSAAAAFGAWKTATNVGAGIQSMMQNANKAQQLAALDAEIAKMRELIQQRQTDSKATLEQQVATGQLTQAQAEEIARRQQLLDEMRQQAGMRTAEEAAQMEAQNAANRRGLEETLAVGQQLVGIYKQEYDEKAKGLALAEEVKRKADERVRSALEYLEAEKEIAATQGSSKANVNEAQADYEAAVAEQVAAAKELKAAQEEADAAATNLNSMAEEVNTLQEELNTTATGANTASTTANTAAENVNTAATTRNTATTTGNTVALRLHTVGTKMAAAGQKILTSAVNFTEAAFQRLKLAIVTNPIGAVLTAISAAIPFFLDFGDANESAAQASERFGKAAADEIDNANVLISTIQNVERTSNVYKQAQDELNKILAQYNLGLIDEKTTTEELIAKKKELVDAINKEAEARTKANAIDTVRNDYKEKQEQWEADLLEGLREAEHIDKVGFAYWDSDKIQEHAEGFKTAMVDAINRELPNLVELEGEARDQAVAKLREQLAKILTDAGVSEYDASFLKGSMNWDGSWNDVLYESINAAIELREQFKENTDIVENFWNKTEEKATKVNLTLAEEYGNTAEEAKKLFDDFQVEQWGKSLGDAIDNADVLSRVLPNIVPSDLDPDKAFDKLLLLEEACKKKIEEVSGQKYHVAVDYTTLYGLRNMLAAIQTQMKSVFTDFKGGEINLNTTNGMGDRIREINKLMGDIDISTSEGREKYAAYKKERDRIQKMLDNTTGKRTGSTGRKYDPKAAEYNRKRLMQDYANDMAEFERDMQNNLTAARIKNMAEGTEKELAQLEQDAKREQQALDDRIKKLVEKKKKLDEQLWVNSGKDRKASDYKPTKTDEQYRAEVMAEVAKDEQGKVIMGADGNPVTVGGLYSAQMVENDTQYQKRRAEIMKSEVEAMRDYLKEYGTIQQRLYAIEKDYNDKIAKETDPYKKKMLEKQKQSEMAGAKSEELAMNIDWSTAFNGVGNVLKDIAKETLAKVEEYMSRDEFKKLDAKDKQSYVELRDQLRKETGGNSTSAFNFKIWGVIEQNVKDYQASIKKLKAAQEAHNAAIQDLKDAERDMETALKSGSKAQIDAAKAVLEAAQDAVNVTADDQIDAKDKSEEAKKKLAENTEKAANGIQNFANYVNEMADGSLSGFANGISKLVTSLSKGSDGVGKSLGELGGKIGGIIGAILQIIDALGDDPAQFIEDLLDKIATVIEKVLEDLPQIIVSVLEGVGNIVGGVIQGVGNLFGADLSGIFGGGTENFDAAVEKWGWLLDTWKDNLEYEKSLMKEAYGSKVTDIQNKTEADLRKSQEAAAQMYHAWASDGAGWFSHSNGYEANRDANWRYLWDYDSELAKRMGASQINSPWGAFISNGDISNLFSLPVEQLKELKYNNSQFWQTLSEEARNYLDQIIELEDEIKQLEIEAREQLTATSFDTIVSDFQNALLDMDSSAEDLAENFQKYMQNAVINSLMLAKYKKQLEDWYANFANAMDSGDKLTKEEQAQLKKDYDDIVNAAIAERNNLRDTLGLETDPTKQEADKKGFAAMSQDTGEELNGRFTAVQIAGENVSAQMNVAVPILTGIGATASRTAEMVDGIGRVADDMLTNIVECYTELNLIRSTMSDDMLPLMKKNKEYLEKIEKNTKTL